MPEPALSAYLHMLDDTWGHTWESLAAALEGVEEAEATWQAPAYADETSADDGPWPGTILWHVAHLAQYKREYAATVRARGTPDESAAPPWVAASNLAEARAALDKAHAAQRAAYAEVADAHLTMRVGMQEPVALATFLAATIRHDAWHGGQIAMLRRLYRKR